MFNLFENNFRRRAYSWVICAVVFPSVCWTGSCIKHTIRPRNHGVKKTKIKQKWPWNGGGGKITLVVVPFLSSFIAGSLGTVGGACNILADAKEIGGSWRREGYMVNRKKHHASWMKTKKDSEETLSASFPACFTAVWSSCMLCYGWQEENAPGIESN